MRRIFLAAALAASATGAAAIDFSDGPVFARCAPYGELAPNLTICEVAFPPGTDYLDYMCAALDADGEPIAADFAPKIGSPGLALNDFGLKLDRAQRLRAVSATRAVTRVPKAVQKPGRARDRRHFDPLASRQCRTAAGQLVLFVGARPPPGSHARRKVQLCSASAKKSSGSLASSLSCRRMDGNRA